MVSRSVDLYPGAILVMNRERYVVISIDGPHLADSRMNILVERIPHGA